MTSYSNSENLDPKINAEHHDALVDNFIGKNPPNLRAYTNSILNISQKTFNGNQLNPSFINVANRIAPLSTSRVPIVKSSDNNSIRRSVKELLLNDASQNDVGVLRQLHGVQNKAYVREVPASPVTPYEKVVIDTVLANSYEIKSKHFNFSRAPSPVAENQLDHVPLLELYKSGADEKMVESLKSSTSVGENGDVVEQCNLDDPRTSYLNPHQAYVKVTPPRLGLPLAKNGTPLDLSLVPRNDLASPLFDLEEKKASDDEYKLLSLLEFEIGLTNDGNITNNPRNDIESGVQNFEFEEQISHQISFKHFFQRFFKRGEFSEEAVYFKRYPWAKILHDIENPRNEAPQVQDVGNFEKNNTDMFAVNVISSPLEDFSENFDLIRRQKHNFVPKIEQPVN